MSADRFQGVTLANPPQAAASAAFVMCPVAVPTAAGVANPYEQVYRLAYEQARAAARPSIVERLQANLLN